MFKIWIHSSFELLNFKSKNGLLKSSLDLNKVCFDYWTITFTCLLPMFWKYSVGISDTRNFLVNHVQPSSQACVDEWDIVVHLYRRLAMAMTIARNCCSINSELFWKLTNRRTRHRNSFAISAFEKTFVEKRYNLFSHWNRDRERLSRFVNTAKHISWHPPTFNSRPLLFDTPIKFGYSNRGLTREVRFSISIFKSSNEERIQILNNKTKSWFLGKTLDLVWLWELFYEATLNISW